MPEGRSVVKLGEYRPKSLGDMPGWEPQFSLWLYRGSFIGKGAHGEAMSKPVQMGSVKLLTPVRASKSLKEVLGSNQVGNL